MVKKILFIQNRTGIKRSNFFDHWENIHAPHMVNVLKPQKYVLTFFEEDIENLPLVNVYPKGWLWNIVVFSIQLHPDFFYEE